MQSHFFHKHRQSFALGVLLLLLFGTLPLATYADRVDELEGQIEDKNKQIQQIQEEINQYSQELSVVRSEKQTLENAITELDLSRQKVTADLNQTQNEIDRAILTVEQLTLEIQEKGLQIDLNQDALGETVRRIHENESQTFVETFLGYDNLSDFWSEVDSLEQFQSVVQQDLEALSRLKKELEQNKQDLIAKEHELSQLQSQLVGQRAVIDQNKAQKDELLDVTESEEAQYQALLAEKIRQREIFQQELNAIEDELRITIDPNALPNAGSGVLAWPLDSILITQYFGNTPFASQNPQVYNGNGHNGVDFSASIGTRVKAALSGTVTATGNTDLQPDCYSYGKWVLIKHNNGLSTLYAHLSVISVRGGDTIKTGDVIGFSGDTGFSTGPHLHFTVYASQGVQVQRFETSINCKNVDIPIAPKEAYLNPLSYL